MQLPLLLFAVLATVHGKLECHVVQMSDLPIDGQYPGHRILTASIDVVPTEGPTPLVEECVIQLFPSTTSKQPWKVRVHHPAWAILTGVAQASVVRLPGHLTVQDAVNHVEYETRLDQEVMFWEEDQRQDWKSGYIRTNDLAFQWYHTDAPRSALFCVENNPRSSSNWCIEPSNAWKLRLDVSVHVLVLVPKEWTYEGEYILDRA